MTSAGGPPFADDAAVMLITHGTVESLDDLPAFLTNIRRGHPAPPEFVAEVRRRYEAMGGKSPLNDYSRSLAKKLEARLRVPVRMAARLFQPYAKDVLAELALINRTTVAVVPLAQHSAAVYASAVEDAAAALMDQKGVSCTLLAAENWGQNDKLCAAFARRIVDALEAGSNHKDNDKDNDAAPAESAKDTTLLFTAHSLPEAIIRAGDPYEKEVRAAALKIGEMLLGTPVAAGLDVRVCFQSQGMSTGPGGKPMPWLGPDLKSAMEAVKGAGKKRVVVAPVGFLADHVEILYDLDIEAAAWAKHMSLAFSRTRSLNDADDLVEVLESVARPLLSRLSEEARGGADAR